MTFPRTMPREAIPQLCEYLKVLLHIPQETGVSHATERGEKTQQRKRPITGAARKQVGYRYPQQGVLQNRTGLTPPEPHSCTHQSGRYQLRQQMEGVMVNRHSQDETKPGGPQDQAAVLTSLLHSNSSWPRLGTSCLAQ